LKQLLVNRVFAESVLGPFHLLSQFPENSFEDSADVFVETDPHRRIHTLSRTRGDRQPNLGVYSASPHESHHVLVPPPWTLHRCCHSCFEYLNEGKLFETRDTRTSTMAESNPGSWTESMSGRERVRHVVELLDEPTPVQTIADRADVSRATADDELQRLQSDDWVTETTVDGTKAYDLNPVRMLFDEVTALIEAHSRDELESQLTELTEEQEELATEYEVDSLDEFRAQLADEEFSAAELRERRNVIATWEAINTELGLVKHALHLYDDVIELSSPRTDSPSPLA
jgi:Mn-dependent DtxR family transcriptional regulator